MSVKLQFWVNLKKGYSQVCGIVIKRLEVFSMVCPLWVSAGTVKISRIKTIHTDSAGLKMIFIHKI